MGTQKIKTNKFLLFALLPLTCFGIIESFLLPSFTAYSRENNSSKEKKENLDCYKNYEKYKEAEAYCNAVVNSKFVNHEKIWRNLTAIVEHNKDLKWENDEVNSRVLVTVWAKRKRYTDEKDEPKGETTAQREIWVTVFPDLHRFCKKYKRHEEIALRYRLNQVLGLAPEEHDDNDKEKKRSVIEIWVEPKDLFRPTPDPEITDSEAELNFPQPYSFMFVSNKYKLWFLNQLMTNDYPWTKLGYTYDWGNKADWKEIDPERPANVGLSEFIIRKGAPIKIHSINTAKNYCS